jgi:hypothetical protein
MSWEAERAGGTTVPLVGGASIVLAAPAGAAREPDEALPAVDVSNLPGAHVVARRGYTHGGLTLRAVCAAAPASGWASGVEEIVLGRATQLAREALGGEVTRFTVDESTAAGPGFAQRFEGAVSGRGEEALEVRGRHWLGFAGEPREAVLCTVVCTESAPARACAEAIAKSEPTGAWMEAPPPNLLARVLLAAAERPYPAAGVLVGVSLAVAALIVARRPRPRA